MNSCSALWERALLILSAALFAGTRYWQCGATAKFPPSLLLVYLLVFFLHICFVFVLYLNRLYTIIFSISYTYKCNHSIYIQLVSSNHVIIIIIIQHKVVSRHHLENSDTSLDYLQLHRHPSKQWYTREELSLWVHEFVSLSRISVNLN